MKTVALDDDSRRRFVIRRYAYDPARRERRHQVVAVLARRRDYDRTFKHLADELVARRKAGDDVDPREYIGGTVLEPGHDRRRANARLLRRAVEHGVWPMRVDLSDLPSSLGVFSSEA